MKGDKKVLLWAVLFLLVSTAAAEESKSDGPFAPNWESIRTHYKVPQWFRDAKFGIFLHWGVYTVPAHGSEWYPRHMVATPAIMQWHREHYGPQNQFGYKDFIPLFKAEKFDPDQWAELFQKAGARYVIPTAEHHDGFAMWKSDLTQWDAFDMGPKRDLVGDLSKAVRAKGMKFGVSNHGMEHWNFMYPDTSLKTDLFDPSFADFYGPPHPPRTEPDSAFQEGFWFARNKELIDQIKPDMLWFDNGINSRALDRIKLKLAAYYYNRALEWGKEVSISSKGAAYLDGSILDFERQGRAPMGMQANVWQVDDPIGHKFGYVEGLQYQTAASIIHKLIENVSKNGNLLLNISPKSDGTIPREQQDILLDVGRWLEINGKAVYGTRPWGVFGEGNLKLKRGQNYTCGDFRFTQKGDTLYAFVMDWPGKRAVITSLARKSKVDRKVKSVALLGHPGKLRFWQDEDGLKIDLPATPPCKTAFAFCILGADSNRTSTHFDFGPGPAAAPGSIRVCEAIPYLRGFGYGFEDTSTVRFIRPSGGDSLKGGFCTGEKPFLFSVKLPEGNYDATVSLGDPSGESATTVKAESRRLVLENIRTRNGETAVRRFTVNIRTPYIPGGGEVKLNQRETGVFHWDDKLTLEFNGPRPCLRSLDIRRSDGAITVYLAGNSTVTDQTREPWASWGQMIPRFFKAGVAVANHAESGEALISFIAQNRLNKILSTLQQGDYLFVEFAHNDQKPGPAYADPFTSYKECLRQFIRETRKRGAVPVLVTSVHRRNFDSTGAVVNTLGDYPEVMRQTAKEEKAALIDLNAMSKVFYEALGAEKSKRAFVHYPAGTFPNQQSELKDNTHFNPYGAYELARCVVNGIRASHLGLAKTLTDDAGQFDPARPDSVETWVWPPSPFIDFTKPYGN
jgi:alpha-L-fucosidase